jgi:hypothetical protein
MMAGCHECSGVPSGSGATDSIKYCIYIYISVCVCVCERVSECTGCPT